MNGRNALVIVVDGLRASALAAYGNSGQATPTFDRLACESLVCDQMLIDSPELAGFYDALWRGRQVLNRPDGVQLSGELTLLDCLAEAGVQISLATDDLWLATTGDELPLAQLTYLETSSHTAAESVAETALGQLLALAAEQFLADESPQNGKLNWIHAAGFYGPWDAPQEMRSQRLTEDDPPPLEFVTPPKDLNLEEPDELLLYRTAYEAQVAVLDQCLAEFLAVIKERAEQDKTLLVVVGSRGFPLGEHGKLGTSCKKLYGELLHVPCFVRLPASSEPIPRFGGLLQPIDLNATLQDWFSEDNGDTALMTPASAGTEQSLLPLIDEEPDDWRQWALARAATPDGRAEYALRTPAWMCHYIGGAVCTSEQSAGEELGDARLELYVKPDDRWESNEVADRCRLQVEAMLALLCRIEQLAASSEPLVLEPINELLVNRLD